MGKPHAIAVGDTFGRWTVIGEGPKSYRRRLSVRCQCGTVRAIVYQSLLTGLSTSCGCYHRSVVRTINRTHGASQTSTFRIWAGMRQRCTNPNNHAWARYGGRGVAVCERWASFENFLSDMGERPADLTLDRWPNNDGNYEPGNCRWATRSQQSRNTRRAFLIDTPEGPVNAVDFARHHGLRLVTVTRRYRKGLRGAALTNPT